MPIFDRSTLPDRFISEATASFIRDNRGNPLKIEDCIFLDTETVPRYKTWKEFQENEPLMAESFIKNKAKNWLEFRDTEMARISKMKEEEIQPVPYDICTEDHEYLYHLRAGLFPEYNKIVCISILYYENGKQKILSFAGDDEKQLLIDFSIIFSGIVQRIQSRKKQPYVVGHNILLFDLPVLYKRMIVNGILPPSLIHADQVKPWEKFAVDTRNIWKAGDKNGDASLDTVCNALGIKSSKAGEHNMDGSKVALEYYEKGNISGIAMYCEEDVEVLAKIFLIYSKLTSYTFVNN
jgi:predicted PolB exonuclease-like 3'-5' exonuclease